MSKTDIRKLDLASLENIFLEMGEKKFRARQVEEWLWKHGARTFDEMTGLSKALRQKLDEKFVINGIELDTFQKSSDGTLKSRFRLYDGSLIESVLIPVVRDKRFTVCVSTQVGCSLSCKFCATGKMKRVRNLDASEIFDQFVEVNKQALEHFGYPLTNVVYMGMGEPLLNYKNTLESIKLISNPKGFNFSPRRITVSTAGIAKMITKLADDEVRFNLALSLHAADDTKRDQIMPINEQNNLSVLMESIEYFYKKTKSKISYEYITFQNFNDSIEDARKLLPLCKRFPVHINIIEYNPIDGVSFLKSAAHKIDDFAKYLTDRGVTVTVRRSRGKDIDAACGQLANKE